MAEPWSLLRRLLGGMVREVTKLGYRLAAIGPGGRAARRFGSFGSGTCISWPTGYVFGERWIHLGEDTLVGSHVTLSAGMVPGQQMVTDPVVRIGDRCLIGRGSAIVGHLSIDIGDDVFTGMNVYITDQNHGYEELDTPIGRQLPSEDPVTSRGGQLDRLGGGDPCRVRRSDAMSSWAPTRSSGARSPTSRSSWGFPGGSSGATMARPGVGRVRPSDLRPGDPHDPACRHRRCRGALGGGRDGRLRAVRRGGRRDHGEARTRPRSVPRGRGRRWRRGRRDGDLGRAPGTGQAPGGQRRPAAWRPGAADGRGTRATLRRAWGSGGSASRSGATTRPAWPSGRSRATGSNPRSATSSATWTTATTPAERVDDDPRNSLTATVARWPVLCRPSPSSTGWFPLDVRSECRSVDVRISPCGRGGIRLETQSVGGRFAAGSLGEGR